MTSIYTFSDGTPIVAETKLEAIDIYKEMLKEEGFTDFVGNIEDPQYQVMPDFEDLNQKYSVVEQDTQKTESGHQYMLETFGQDLKKAELTHPNNIWTIVNGEGDVCYTCPGLHYVNRVGYLQTLKPWQDHNLCFLW